MQAVVRPCCCTPCCTDLTLTRQGNSVRVPSATLHWRWPLRPEARFVTSHAQTARPSQPRLSVRTTCRGGSMYPLDISSRQRMGYGAVACTADHAARRHDRRPRVVRNDPIGRSESVATRGGTPMGHQAAGELWRVRQRPQGVHHHWVPDHRRTWTTSKRPASGHYYRTTSTGDRRRRSQRQMGTGLDAWCSSGHHGGSRVAEWSYVLGRVRTWSPQRRCRVCGSHSGPKSGPDALLPSCACRPWHHQRRDSRWHSDTGHDRHCRSRHRTDTEPATF